MSELKNQKLGLHTTDLDDIFEMAKEQKDLARQRRADIATIKSSEGMSGVDSIPVDMFKWMTQYKGITVEHFPPHLFPPRGSITVDIRESYNLSSPNTQIMLVDFEVPTQMVFFWRSYSLFSDVPKGVEAEWFIKVNGVSAFKYHGSSMDNYRKTLALGQDLSSEIDALQEIAGGSRITIEGTVTDSSIPITIAARIHGWLVSSNTMKIWNSGS